MDKQRKKQIKRYISWGLMVLLVAALAAMPLIAGSNGTADGPQASILSTSPEKRTIETRIIGGGQLAGSSTEEITIPEDVKLVEYLVGNGDTVQKGDPIARVDKVTVMKALQEVQETLDYLAEEIADSVGTSQTETVTAHAGGLVKILYAEKDEDVRDVMLRDGALAVLSLDSRMAVEIQRDTELAVGDTVCVRFSDDTEEEGRVEATAGGVLRVSIADDGYAIGEKVTVTTEDGDRIGTGTLEINSPWRATANQGMITKVNVKEGDSLKAGRTLFQLEVSGQSSQTQLLHSQRQEYEELMQELFSMYTTGMLTAPCDGLITGVDIDGAFLLAAAEQDVQLELLRNVVWHSGPAASVTLLSSENPLPGGTGETENPGDSEDSEDTEDSTVTTGGYVASVASVTEKVITLTFISGPDNAMPTQLEITTYADGTAIAVGDIVTVSLDGTTIQKIGSSGTTDSGQGDVDQSMTGSMAGMSGMSGMGGMGGSVQVFEPYSLETITVASVTSQEEMKLEITVDEQDIARIALGQEATIVVEALTGQQFPAVITAINNTGTNEGGSSKFTATLTLGKSGDMLPGMNASAYLILSTTDQVLTVPVAALAEENGKTLVYTGYDEKKEMLTNPVEVTTGVSDGEYVEILSGLSESDTVWYAYYDTLERGQFPL